MALSVPTSAAVVKKEAGEEENEYGVLLYYKYVEIPDLQSLLSFFDSNCNSLSLLGRVRLSSHGVNVTVGGKLWALKKHIESVKSIPLFQGTDFKLASSHFPFSNDKVARECGFGSLSIRIVKELVTLCPNPQLNPPDISNAGRHLSAAEFHSLLHNAEHVVDEKSSKGLVLLDARNLYETRIGKFRTPAVKTLDPGIRQYSDLPSWIDDNSEQLRGKNVLMYCTGGIRCEMASAYIRSKGAGFENVFQLFGGIQRYLEQFPDGGFFTGKNFVFDHRISVGSSDTDILGACLLCSLSFDDYSARCRCSYCRMLVLVCNKCQTEEAAYVCELCQKHGRSMGPVPLIGTGKTEEAAAEIQLQTTDPDAAPQLQRGQGKVCICITGPVDFTLATYLFSDRGAGTPRKLRILCLHGFRQNASSFKGRTASLAKKLKNIAELIFVDAPHELPFIYQPRVTEPERSNGSSFPLQQTLPPVEKCRKKFAWLMAPDSKGRSETDWEMADIPFDSLQYQHQIEGFDASLEYLKTVFSQKGPFDGMLGFSQGATMAALVCMQKLRLGDEIDFRFVILCSGFALQLREIQGGTINCPSLHIFGSVSGSDRQIANQESRNLASMFDEGCSVIIEHDCGHIIPTRPPYIDEIKSFLLRFL